MKSSNYCYHHASIEIKKITNTGVEMHCVSCGTTFVLFDPTDEKLHQLRFFSNYEFFGLTKENMAEIESSPISRRGYLSLCYDKIKALKRRDITGAVLKVEEEKFINDIDAEFNNLWEKILINDNDEIIVQH